MDTRTAIMQLQSFARAWPKFGIITEAQADVLIRATNEMAGMPSPADDPSKAPVVPEHDQAVTTPAELLSQKPLESVGIVGE